MLFRNLLAATALLSSFSVEAAKFFPTFSSASYLHCYNGEVELALEADGRVFEVGETNITDLLSQKNVLKIKTKSDIYTYEHNVIVVTDGAGNDAVQVLAQDDFGPLKPVVEFTFEHEGNYLAGFYSLPEEKEYLNNSIYQSYRFEKSIDFVDENMKCNFSLEDMYDNYIFAGY